MSKRRFQTGGQEPSDASIGKAALLSDPEAQAALADQPAPKPVHPQVARALAVASLRRQRRRAMAGMPAAGFQYGGVNTTMPPLPPMPQMPDLARELANLRQAGLISGQQQLSPMDVLQEMKGLQQPPDFQTPPFLGMGKAQAKVNYPTVPSVPDPSNPSDDNDADDTGNAGGGRFRDPGEYAAPKKAKGGILRRRPKAIIAIGHGPGGPEHAGPPPEDGPKHHMIPVFSTTIIIAHKKPGRSKAETKKEPKLEAKAKGGPIRTTKPRGAGIAKRGMRFSGIF